MDAQRVSITQRILSAVGSNCLSVALVVAVLVPPATGYELSILEEFPVYFWVLIAAGSACGIFTILLQGFVERGGRSWILGLGLVAASNSLLLFLPVLHGYATYPKGDALTHLGYIKDIVQTGHVGTDDFYPIVHVLGATLNEVSGVDRGTLPVLLYTSWSLIYLLGMTVLSKVVASSTRQRFLILSFASPLLFSNMQTVIHPSMFAIFLIPLVLYFYHRKQHVRSRQIEQTLALLILAFAVTFAHPVTAVFAALLLASLTVSARLHDWSVKRNNGALEFVGRRLPSYGIPTIMLVTFFIWYLSYASITRSVRAVYEWLVSPQANSVFGQQTSLLSLSGLSPIQTVELFTFRYGSIAVYLVVSVVALAIAVRKRVHRGSQFESMTVEYASGFVAGGIASAYSLLGFTGETDPIRISRFFLFVSPLLCGLVLGGTNATGKRDMRQSRRLIGPRGEFTVVGSILTVAVILSSAGLFGSPLNAQANWQVSRMELSGAMWLTDHGTGALFIHTLTGSDYVKRLQAFNCGVDTCLSNALRNVVDKPIPSHFGYPNNDTMAKTFGFQDAYILTYQEGRVSPLDFPENVRPLVHQYTPSDFDRLATDSTVSKLYSNGEFEVWIVAGS